MEGSGDGDDNGSSASPPSCVVSHSTKEDGDVEGMGANNEMGGANKSLPEYPSHLLAFKLDSLSLNPGPATSPRVREGQGVGSRSGCSTPHSDSTLEDTEQADGWESEPQPLSLSELASGIPPQSSASSHSAYTDTVPLRNPPLRWTHPYPALSAHHPPPHESSSGVFSQQTAQLSDLVFEDAPARDQWAGPTSEEGQENKVYPWQQWTATFHEVDLSQCQGSQSYEDEHFAMLPPKASYNPYSSSSQRSAFEGSHSSAPSLSPGLQPPTASGSSGYHSDGGLSTTSSMEELSIINTETQQWPSKVGQSKEIVKPLAVSREGVSQQYHTQNTTRSIPQAYVLPWQHSHSLSYPMQQGLEYSLSQPCGGVGGDLYGYTLSQPTGVGYPSSQLGLTVGGWRAGFLHSAQSREVKMLHNAAATGKHLLLRRLLSGSHPHLSAVTRNESWCTPIHQAAHHGHLHCLKFLIQQAPPNAVHLWDNDCNTPTLLAIQHGHLECVKWLVEEAGVPMIVSDSGGETLLHYAAFHGQDKILEWLLERVRTTDDTSDVDDIMDHSGVTPGHFAAYYGHLACLQLLWAQGVDLAAKDKFDHTPADWARSAAQSLSLNYLTTVETCCNLMEENSELQQQVFDLQVHNQQLLERVRCMSSSHQREVTQLRHEYEAKMEKSNVNKPRRLKGHEAYRILSCKQPVTRHSLEDIEVQKERAKEELKRRRQVLCKKLQDSRDQKDPKDVLAVIRALSPMSPIMRRERKRLSAVHGQSSKTKQDTASKSVTFADEVAATAHQQQHKRSTSLVEIDIDAAIRRNSLDHSKPAGPQDRGYREVSIDRALGLEDANTTLEVNIDEVIQKRGPRLHRGIMKRTHT